MAEFLDTEGVSHRLVQIIKNAENRLVIISPFLKINERIKEHLADRDRFKIDIRVVYGKNELQPEENNWLESMASIRTSFLQDLHAKCYLNEKEALLTSMNLYKYSQEYNYEMGIVVSHEEDPDLYESICEESDRIIRTSDEIRVKVSRVEADDDKEGGQATEGSLSRKDPESGFCIRCQADLPANPAQPYCRSCYASWRRNGKDKTSKEKHCHICGSEHAATLLKPACRSCYGKYKDVLEFAA